jgi:hypothetical protein
MTPRSSTSKNRFGPSFGFMRRTVTKKALGPEHPAVAMGLENYAELLTHLKRDKEAADLRAQAIAIRARLASRS